MSIYNYYNYKALVNFRTYITHGKIIKRFQISPRNATGYTEKDAVIKFKY